MSKRSQPDPMLREWIDAVERGDTAVAADLLQRGMNVDAGRDRTNTTALMTAVKHRQIEMIQFLLEHGADQSLENSLGHTAMTYAVLDSRSWGNEEHVPRPDPRPLELLLAAGGRYRLREAVLLNDVELARTRLDEGADVDTGAGTYEGPLLKIAAESGQLELVELLLDRGADVEATDDLGQRALMSAARYGQTAVVRRLLDHGADLDAVDWSGQSALSNAAVEGRDELVDLLLSRGAQRGIVDALALSDMTLLEALLDQRLRCESDVDRLSDGRGRLAMLAVKRGNLAAVRLLLDRGAVHLHKWFDDHTLLAEAARQGHVDVVRLLIDRGADLHAAGRDGLTPLAWATSEGQEESCRMLRHAGATR